MSKFDDLSERILRAAGRMPGRAVVVLTLLFYAGGGLALPLALGWSRLGLVEANFLWTMLAGLLIFAWVATQFEAGERRRQRRHLLEWTTELRHLNAQEFEWLVGEVFRREGWKVRETGRQDGPDGNIDLELTRDGQRMIVQCKRWSSKLVDVHEIREFGGTLLRERLPPHAGIFVTLSDFFGQARAEAEETGIIIVDNRDLCARIEKVRRPELCDICQRPMILDHSQHGWWFRCIAGCPGKRDLGKDAGRAVEFLTQPPLT